MSRCIHVYSFVARNHGGIPFSGVCPRIIPLQSEVVFRVVSWKYVPPGCNMVLIVGLGIARIIATGESGSLRPQGCWILRRFRFSTSVLVDA